MTKLAEELDVKRTPGEATRIVSFRLSPEEHSWVEKVKREFLCTTTDVMRALARIGMQEDKEQKKARAR